MTGNSLNGVTWLGTIRTDGTNSNNEGGTCVNDLTIQSGSRRRHYTWSMATR